ncbi:MAG: hypothetical protein R3C56_07470 [Pirellulaceae bacterium]
MNDMPTHFPSPSLPRRTALKSLASGFGYLAFANLAQEAAARDAAPKADPLARKATHFPAKAKRVIFLCMNGGPSHVDLVRLQAVARGARWRPSTSHALAGNAGRWALLSILYNMASRVSGYRSSVHT